MSRGKKQKLKLLYLAKIMLEETDEDHRLTIADLIEELAKYGVTAERRSLYDDLSCLEEFGLMAIHKVQEKGNVYYFADQKLFSDAELRLFADSMASSRFITERKSKDLIKKLASLTSVYTAGKMKREIAVDGRIKSMNSSIFYQVDAIQDAIAQNKQIQFSYYHWNLQKKLERSYSSPVTASPWGLVSYEDRYYLAAFDETDQFIRNYRVDKIRDVKILDKPREGRADFGEANMADYVKNSFGMFTGERTPVELVFDNDLAGVLIDRFGTEMPIQKEDDFTSRTCIDITVSPQFYGWLLGLGSRIHIAGPENIKWDFLDYVDEIRRSYID